MKEELFLTGVVRGIVFGLLVIIFIGITIYCWGESREHGHAKRKMSEKCDPYQECTQCSIDCSTWEIKRLQSR